MFRARLVSVLLLMVCALSLVGCGTPESRKQRYMERGREYEAKQNWEKARIEFRNALQIVPKDAEALYESGFAAEKLGKPRDAVAFYQSALESKPGYVEAAMRLARLLLLGGAIERANEVLAPVIEKNPTNPSLLTIRAGIRAQQKDLPGAVADAEAAYKATPDAEDTVAVLAGLYQSAGRRDEALKVLEDGVKRVPASVDLRLALVQTYLSADRRDDAEQGLKALVQMQPNHPEHVLRLAKFYAQTDRVDLAEQTLRDAVKAKDSPLEVKLALTQLLFERKGKDAAETELKALVAANPKTTELQFALAQLYSQTNELDKASTVLKDVVAAAGTRPPGIEARDALAQIRLREGNNAEVARLVGEVLAVSPRDTQALSMRADLALGKNDARSAIADLRSVLRDTPNSAPAIRALARAHLMNAEPAQAEEVLRRGVDANPADVGLALALVDVLGREGKGDQARSTIESLYKRAPRDANVVEAMFKSQVLRKDFKGAHETAAQAKVAVPTSALGYYLDALAFEAEGNGAAALDAYAAALDKAPAAPEVLRAYAVLAVREKKADQLRARLTKSTAEVPKAATPWQLLGELNLGEHKLAEATTAFTKAVELAPDRLEGYRGLSIVKVTGGDVDGGVAVLKDALAKVARPDDAQFEIAALYQQQKRNDDAQHAYEALLAKNPGYQAAANNLAMLLVSRGDAQSLDKAKALTVPFAQSPNPRFVDTYGWVLTVRGEYAAAISALSKIVDSEPNAASVRYHLAVAQIRGGQVAAGRDNLERALKGGDQFEGGAEARALLQSIKK